MQKQLYTGKRLGFNCGNENYLDFQFCLNGSGFQTFIHDSIYITVTRSDGSVYFTGRLFDLYVFQSYYTGGYGDYARVLRHYTSFKYNPGYGVSDNYDHVAVFVPVGSQVDIVCGVNFGHYVKSVYLNCQSYGYDGDLSVISKNILRKDFVGDELVFDSITFVCLLPQYIGDLSVATYPQFASIFNLVCREFIGGISEDYSRRLDLSYFGNSQLNKLQNSMFRGNFHQVSIRKVMIGNSNYYLPYVAYYFE